MALPYNKTAKILLEGQPDIHEGFRTNELNKNIPENLASLQVSQMQASQ